MLTLLHTLANSAGLFKNAGPASPQARNASVQINRALQNVNLIRKTIATENLDDAREQAAFRHLDLLLDQLSVNSVATLSYAQVDAVATTLVSASFSSDSIATLINSIRASTPDNAKDQDDDSASVTSSEGPSSAVTVVDELDHLSLSHWAKAGIANVTGSALAPQVLKMSTRSNAASAILGAVSSPSQNNAVTALASSAAIVNMVPNLYQIAHAATPVVFHVSAESVDSDLNTLRGDYSDVLVARETGLLFIASSTVQEAYDVSILSHAIASGTNQSLIHILDGVRTSQQVEAIQTRQKTVLGHDEGSLVSGIEDIFERASQLLGREYKAFEYSGPQDAETIVVVFGPAANVAKNLGDKVGVLNIRVYRPWSFAHFLKAVPRTAKTVIVVEPVSASSAPGAVFLDVSASFNVWTGPHRPTVIDAKYGHHGASLSQGWLKALVQKALTTSGVLDLSTEDIKQAIFWETVASTPVSAHVAKHLNILGNRIQHSSTINSYRHSAVIETQLKYSKSRATNIGEFAIADYASVQDVSILTEYNVINSLKTGAKLLLNTPWSVDELEVKTSAAFRHALGAKQIQVLLVDFDGISKDLGLGGSGKTLLGQVAFLKINSSSLHEAAFEKVSLQYETSNNKLLKELVVALVERVDKEIIEVPQNPNWLAIELGEADQAALALPTHVHPTIRGISNAFDVARVPIEVEAESGADGDAVALGKTFNWHEAAWQLLFSEAYETKNALSDEDHSYLVTLTENRRLTPSTYDRNVFHLEFDTTNTGLKYELGDALGIHGWNDTQEVLDFIEFYGAKPETVVVTPRPVPKNSPEGALPRYQTNTLLQILQQTSDLFGRPSKRFYADLIPYATNAAEKERLTFLISPEGAEEFKARVDETLTHADILREFPSAHPSVPQLINMIPAIKPRHYSIASSMKAHPNSVHLLIVAVEWTAPSGKERFGQCTRYLTQIGAGAKVTVSIKPSVMKLPPLPHQPVIMAGLGTGMAPFRAFIQERAWQKAQGMEVGPMILYFGSRNRSNEYLYGEELEAYHADGLLTHLRLAFSRDQREKVYIQHKMQEDGHLLHKYMLDKSLSGHFYLCGPTWPAGDVKDAIVQSFMDGEGCAVVDANRIVNKLKEDERYILEVY
ncbi:hypothetical protein BGW38_000463 [Lunasporangiospora selenospora]|uniref:assimilatory sulfite reductase (NADPH) n=1 Tax=Lunasporangiospora selenospora TaxID=979761 RepID=A0A9P6FUU2_9FUNG|nr:hypothetical protein BGW38_000463 [Lunasporangiospora selenospora]